MPHLYILCFDPIIFYRNCHTRYSKPSMMLSPSVTRFFILTSLLIISIGCLDNKENSNSYVKYTKLSNSNILDIKKVSKYFDLFGLDRHLEVYLKGKNNTIDLEQFQSSVAELLVLPTEFSSECKVALISQVEPAFQYLNDNSTKKLVTWFLTSPLARCKSFSDINMYLFTKKYVSCLT